MKHNNIQYQVRAHRLVSESKDQPLHREEMAPTYKSTLLAADPERAFNQYTCQLRKENIRGFYEISIGIPCVELKALELLYQKIVLL